jgi:hypothetical protein
LSARLVGRHFGVVGGDDRAVGQVGAVDGLELADGRGLAVGLVHGFDRDLNVAATAKALCMYPNSVRYRLRRIAQLTGHNPHHLTDLLELHSAAWLILASKAAAIVVFCHGRACYLGRLPLRHHVPMGVPGVGLDA